MRLLRSALLATLVLACKGTQPIGADPWLNDAPGLFGAGWVRVSPQDIEPVWPAERLGAAERLETQPWLVISPTQAERLTGATRKSGKIPYLLRGLCIGCSKGDFMLLRRGTEFAVHYAGAVILDKRVRQWPVVAWLDQAPTQLYVSCSAT